VVTPLNHIELDPISEVLKKLHLPRWSVTALMLEPPWAIEMDEGIVTMFVVQRGCVWFQWGSPEESPIKLSAGDHLIATRGVAHQVASAPDKNYIPIDHITGAPGSGRHHCSNATELIHAQFDIRGLRINPLEIGLPDIVHLNHSRDRELSTCLPLLKLIRSVSREMPRGWKLTVEKLAELVFVNTLAVELGRRSFSETESGEFRLMRAVTDTVVGPVLKSLIDHPETPWTVPMMSRMAKVSKSAFSERFRNLVGVPPLQYLTEMRMRKARRLLRESDIGIANIATLVGYESPSSFSNVFKRWTGQSPAEYRRQSDGVP
tara:strand:- start:87407 stop:88363 length:957 start_codon:yes stop_codon:yes gene_type:complete